MWASNVSTTSDFTLVGLFSHTGPHLILFFLVATMFTTGLLGNTILIFLIATDSRLHTPMYFLLSQLSLLDIGFPLVTIPKMVADFLQERNVITFGGCATQMFFLMLMGVSEGVLLSFMSYDRYVAVCHPMHYQVLMRGQVCLVMVGASWFSGALVASIQTSITMRFPYCASHTVDHFFCELPALLKLSCADTSTYELALSVSGVLILLLPLSLVFTSYGHVLGAVLHMRSAEARHKAFTTCSSHMAVDNMVSLFYSLITPTLNPLIYSLRNREVRMAFVKAMGRANFRVKQ
ncbi:Olfactory receptor 2Z1 [Microtus ochrogaster]|uniref:Olfactory receptor n=1 Tax=Microtus ochrogaster TaxID=79684 RepID=A0A8J6KR10_MICOH|nr:Olfactory receptor 2Z1 [Microtus ochrogaster]